MSDTLTVRCPRCGNRMKYQPKGKLDSTKKKQCVYCGFGIRAANHLRKSA